MNPYSSSQSTQPIISNGPNHQVAQPASFPVSGSTGISGNHAQKSSKGDKEALASMPEAVEARVSMLAHCRALIDGRDYSTKDSAKLKKRSLRMFWLGASLAPILDIENPTVFAKSLMALFHEFEYEAGVTTTRKVYSTYKKMIKKAMSSLVDESSTKIEHTGLYSHLDTITVPFDIDLVQTYITLCDLISEVYQKMLTVDWSTPDHFWKLDAKLQKAINSARQEIEPSIVE